MKNVRDEDRGNSTFLILILAPSGRFLHHLLLLLQTDGRIELDVGGKQRGAFVGDASVREGDEPC